MTNSNNRRKFTKKQLIEKDFHNEWANSVDPSDIDYIKPFQATTAIENQYALSVIKPIKGKKILDIGCGIGDASLFFASKGAIVEAMDISDGMIKLLNTLAKKHSLDKKITAKVMPAEKLSYKSNSFDYIYGNGLLHHTDWNDTIKEVRRVLKKGGSAVFVEPLAHNPIINIYRKLADKVRTTTEKPLNYSDLETFKSYDFSSVEHKEFHLTTLLIFIWFYAINRVSPNKERYWKKIIEDEGRISKAFTVLQKLDTTILKLFPFTRRYCWNTVLVFTK